MDIEALARLSDDDVKSRFGWPEYQVLLAHPGWTFFLQFIQRTREYDRGLEIGFNLLELTETYKRRMTVDIHTKCLGNIYPLILRMLDKMDRWEQFIQAPA